MYPRSDVAIPPPLGELEGALTRNLEKSFVDRGLLKPSVDFFCILRRKRVVNLPAHHNSPPWGELEGVSFDANDTLVQAK